MQGQERALVLDVIATGKEVAVRTNPVFEDLGARIVGAAPGEATMRFGLGPRTRQGDGLVHGGVISTMLDGTMAFAVLSRLDDAETAATISLNIQFMGAVGEGDCTVCARAEQKGGRIRFASAELVRDGVVAASATAVFAVRRRRG